MKPGTELSDLVARLENLSTTQLEVVSAIIDRFAGELECAHLDDSLLTDSAFEYFSVRLAAHHAFSSSRLKKENFEHIIEEALKRTGTTVERVGSMTVRGADLTVAGVPISLKTEAAKGLRPEAITISKLMEAAWIKQIREPRDIPSFVQSMVMPHLENYDRIFILRAYTNPERLGFTRYDLREIPTALLKLIGGLSAADFRPLTRTRTTSAKVLVDGAVAFTFRLDGSDDKLTISRLDTRLCPLHAWWTLADPS